jgi:hypothetical protein
MEDALWAQLQNTSLEEYDDKDRIEPESDLDEEKDQAEFDESVCPRFFMSTHGKLSNKSIFIR